MSETNTQEVEYDDAYDDGDAPSLGVGGTGLLNNDGNIDVIHVEDIDSIFYIDYSRKPLSKNSVAGIIGSNIVVRKAIERKTGKRFAIKSFCFCLKKEKKDTTTTTFLQGYVAKEAKMMMMCQDHTNISNCYGVYYCEDNNTGGSGNSNIMIHLVMEYIHGGELYQRLVERANNNNKSKRNKKMNMESGSQPLFTEQEVVTIMLQLLSAVKHCHAMGVVHRDLKLENILLTNKSSNTKDGLTIKLIDFGLATPFCLPQQQQKLPLTERVGTNYYIAPEVLNAAGGSSSTSGSNGYDERCDIWSIGVIAYALLSGTPPFRGITDADTYELILSLDKQVEFGSGAGDSDGHVERSCWKNVSIQAKEFIKACLQKDPTMRPKAEVLLQHEWLQCTVTRKTTKKNKEISKGNNNNNNHSMLHNILLFSKRRVALRA